jgi:Rrf2 family protein
MATNCRFAFAVHVLSVLALYSDEPLTSDLLAQSVNTNPVIIRRLLGELAEAGLVETQRGPGGGARLAQPAESVTLLQIHRAVAGEVEPFGEHPHQPAQSCAVGREIKRVLEDVAQRAKVAVEREYEAISLAEVARQIRS